MAVPPGQIVGELTVTAGKGLTVTVATASVPEAEVVPAAESTTPLASVKLIDWVDPNLVVFRSIRVAPELY